MKTDIILSGVGGQGILSIAAVTVTFGKSNSG
jgi:Pyruvate/2-oxoacid:ferredoxin oxidoreductase gamma subunit